MVRQYQYAKKRREGYGRKEAHRCVKDVARQLGIDPGYLPSVVPKPTSKPQTSPIVPGSPTAQGSSNLQDWQELQRLQTRMNELTARGCSARGRAEEGRKVWEEGMIEAEECRREIQSVSDEIGALTRRIGAWSNG